MEPLRRSFGLCVCEKKWCVECVYVLIVFCDVSVWWMMEVEMYVPVGICRWFVLPCVERFFLVWRPTAILVDDCILGLPSVGRFVFPCVKRFFLYGKLQQLVLDLTCYLIFIDTKQYTCTSN